MKFNKKTFEIIFFARAGQGAKSAAEILAQAALVEGKYVQAFPYYGPVRSGAPTQSYVRISDEPIRTHEPIIDPDVVAVLDDTLLSSEDVTNNLDKNETLIVNTNKLDDEIRNSVNNFSGNIKAVDGNEISRSILGQERPNITVLGKLVQVTEIIKLSSLEKAIKKVFGKKFDKELIDKNIKSAEVGYDSL